MNLRLLVLAVIFLTALGGFGRVDAEPSSQALPSSPDSGFAPESLQWQPVSAGLESPFVLWFSPDYASSGRLWAATDYTLRDVGYGYGVIYSSVDRGVGWQGRSSAARRLLLAAFAPTGGDPLSLALESYYDANYLKPPHAWCAPPQAGPPGNTVWGPVSALFRIRSSRPTLPTIRPSLLSGTTGWRGASGNPRMVGVHGTPTSASRSARSTATS